MAPDRPLLPADYPQQPFRQMEGVGVLKDMLVAEEKETGGRQIPYIRQDDAE